MKPLGLFLLFVVCLIIVICLLPYLVQMILFVITGLIVIGIALTLFLIILGLYKIFKE